MTEKNIIEFWFGEIDQSLWFAKDEKFDDRLRLQFSETYKQVMAGEKAHWRATPEGRLAEILVLDQFARNMFRDTAQAFAGDSRALSLAQETVAAGDDMKLPVLQRNFIYMPYMHSEDRAAHETALKLFAQPGLESNLQYEIKHKKIIDRFGRFPHRNEILGRKSTPEEIEFLKQPGSSF